MKILVVYPTPFYSSLSQGNYTRLISILETGNDVDLLTFPDGENIEHSGLKMIRFPSRSIFNVMENGQYLKILIYSLLLFFKLLFMEKKKFIYGWSNLVPSK